MRVPHDIRLKEGKAHSIYARCPECKNDERDNANSGFACGHANGYEWKPWAAVSLVTRIEDSRVLAVWNRRYKCWALPGGKVEDDETIEQAQARELREETSLITRVASKVYEAPSASDTQRSYTQRIVSVFLVWACGVPTESEAGSPVMWMDWGEFRSTGSVFMPFYDRMNADLAERTPTP